MCESVCSYYESWSAEARLWNDGNADGIHTCNGIFRCAHVLLSNGKRGKSDISGTHTHTHIEPRTPISRHNQKRWTRSPVSRSILVQFHVFKGNWWRFLLCAPRYKAYHTNGQIFLYTTYYKHYCLRFRFDQHSLVLCYQMRRHAIYEMQRYPFLIHHCDIQTFMHSIGFESTKRCIWMSLNFLLCLYQDSVMDINR